MEGFYNRFHSATDIFIENTVAYVLSSGGLYILDVSNFIGIEEGTPSKLETSAMNVYPNPFNAVLRIKIAPVEMLHPTPLRLRVTGATSPLYQSPIHVKVYDISGRLVEKLLPSIQSSTHPVIHESFTWFHDISVSSGIYFVRAKSGEKASRNGLCI
ncbi:T9SS type A sorting domain-containing protein [bacterium]|nr:T9SS type A sorting domain-containing protein [bacterium]